MKVLLTLLALCVACGPHIVPVHGPIHTEFVSCAGSCQEATERCDDAAIARVQDVENHRPSVAGQVMANAVVGALAGAATGAAVGAAVGGNAGYGAKVGTAAWGTEGAVLGPVSGPPDRYQLWLEAYLACLDASGTVVRSVTPRD